MQNILMLRVLVQYESRALGRLYTRHILHWLTEEHFAALDLRPLKREAAFLQP